MKWPWNRNAVVEEERPPVAVAITPQTTHEEVQRTIEIQTRLGMKSHAAVTELLKLFLVDNNICVYPLHKVHDYMDYRYGRYSWGWSQLRDSDHPNRPDMYRGQIPLPVLERIEQLDAAFPNQLLFEIASEGRGDPFLSVRLLSSIDDNERLVIERWDEPGFRL